MENAPALDWLIFAPHPDDAEIGMGGSIAKALAAGKRVGVIDLTRGEAGTKGNATLRAQEAAAATDLLGLHYRGNLDLGDGRIMDNETNRLLVAEAIRRCQSPDLFVCPPFDRHPDHQAAGRLVQAAFFLARLPKVETQSPAFSPNCLFYYFIHDQREVSFAVDISAYMETKRQALRCYASQFVDPQVPEGYRHVGTSNYLAHVDGYNRAMGAQIGAEFAEGFSSPALLSLNLPGEG